MLSRVWDRIVELALIDPQKGEIGDFFLSVSLGLQLIFGSPVGVPSLHQYLTGPVGAWGLLLISVGLWQGTALWYEQYSHRRAASFAVCCVWTFVAVHVLPATGVGGTAFILSAYIACSAGWSYLQIRWRAEVRAEGLVRARVRLAP